MPTTSSSGSLDVAIVGGGLGGLAAATLLARAGRGVTLFEKARDLGGRATTRERAGFRFNLGPHALYRGGAGVKLLRDLGVEFSGGMPKPSGGFALDRGSLQTLPGGFVSLLTTRLLPLPAKVETARLLAGLARIDARAVASVPLGEWLETTVAQPATRRLLRALVRLATYADDPERQSAGAAIAQLQSAVAQNVLYLDGGWQTLVDGLRAAGTRAGARLVTGTRVVAVEHDGSVRAVRLADGTRLAAAAAIIAAGPHEALALVEHGDRTPLAGWAADAIPIEAACFDVALERLPRPRATFALGIDRPLYCSVHSAVAKLAPDGAATVQLAKYLGPAGSVDPAGDERELETLLDRVQPGWRGVMRERRWLPRMVVSSALVTARAGGTAGRPGPAVPGVRNLHVVGDWTGPDGMLADASLASARRATDLILRTAHSAAAA
jgi:phytoene dehydrogenase-like protein